MNTITSSFKSKKTESWIDFTLNCDVINNNLLLQERKAMEMFHDHVQMYTHYQKYL